MGNPQWRQTVFVAQGGSGRTDGEDPVMILKRGV